MPVISQIRTISSVSNTGNNNDIAVGNDNSSNSDARNINYYDFSLESPPDFEMSQASDLHKCPTEEVFSDDPIEDFSSDSAPVAPVHNAWLSFVSVSVASAAFCWLLLSGDSKFQIMMACLIFNIPLSIHFLNCNGIRDLSKRTGLTQWLRSLPVRVDVVCLQETPSGFILLV